MIPDPDSGWVTLSGSRIGSVHLRDELPIQDAVLTWSEGDQAVVAVADGHGHRLHFRSDTGSALAVVCAVEELRRVLPDLVDPETAGDVVSSAAATIVESWTTKVRHHVEANPFTPAQAEEGAAADPLQPYGSTLLAAAVSGDLMVFLQIGDGDSVIVSTRGEASRPLPEDPDLDGLHTSSLCQPDPLKALRVAVVDTRVEDVVLAFLCTDGFGTSRVDSGGWWRQTGEQLVEFGRRNGLAWIQEQLPDWLDEPAQIGGDDCSMAIMARAGLGPSPGASDAPETVEVPRVQTVERPVPESAEAIEPHLADTVEPPAERVVDPAEPVASGPPAPPAAAVPPPPPPSAAPAETVDASPADDDPAAGDEDEEAGLTELGFQS